MTLERDLAELQERRTDKLEIRVTELERQIQVIRLALEVLKKWMEFTNETYKIDQNLFDSLNERVTALENKS